MSIDLHDLRLNNWVNFFYYDFEMRVDVPRQVTNYFFSMSEKDLQDFEPIPLTPELLEKCGFEKRSRHLGNAFTINVGDFDLSFKFYKAAKEWVEFKILGNGGYDEGGEMDITKVCQHLHQFQNIFYSLTGTELQFTL